MRFVEEYCEETPEGHVVFNVFYVEFCKYLKDNRLRIMTKRSLSKVLRDEGFQVKGRRTTAEDGSDVQTTCIFCLKLKNEIMVEIQEEIVK